MSQQFDCLTLVKTRAEAVLTGVTAHVRQHNRLYDGETTFPVIVVSQVSDPVKVLEWMPDGTVWEYAVRATLFDALADPKSAAEFEAKTNRAELFQRGMYDASQRPTGCFQVDADFTNPVEPTSGPTRTYATTAVVLKFQFQTTRPG